MSVQISAPPVAADEGRRSMIVQMERPEDEVTTLAQAASVGLHHRSLALSARDCLPPKREDSRDDAGGLPHPMLRGDAFALRASLLVQAQDALEPHDVEERRREELDRLQPLLDHEVVQTALGERGATDDGPAELWTSGALVLDVTDAELEQVRRDVPGIGEVFSNQPMRIPPVVEVLNPPEAVREARSHTYGLKAIGALAAWGAYGTRGEGVRVAVLDTGVDADHPDLAGKIDGWAEFDANGAAVASTPFDDNGHGTHVAGTVAGGNASGQWIGVAPDARLYCARVLGPTGGTPAQIISGLRWAIEQEVDIISMSLGGLVMEPDMPDTYTRSIVNAMSQGIPVIIAVGNEGSQTTGSPGNDFFALTVGASDHADRPAGFSGGRTQIVRHSPFLDPAALPLAYSKPDITAPGVAVRSAYVGGEYASLQGTSMATPHVAGAAALLLSATDKLSAVAREKRALALSDLLVGSVSELGEAGQDHRYGFGRVDVLRAIDFARERGY